VKGMSRTIAETHESHPGRRCDPDRFHVSEIDRRYLRKNERHAEFPAYHVGDTQSCKFDTTLMYGKKKDGKRLVARKI